MTSMTGTWTLIRFILRRDRVRLPVWIGAIVGFFTFLAATFPSLYPTEQERQARATLMENPTAMAFRGPGYGFEDYTWGAMLAHEMMGYAAIAAALMSIFLVVRHTRSEEESGRLELVRSSIVGRFASPAAALTVVIGANLAIAILFAGLLPLMPGDYTLAGSLAFGFGVASVGVVFAGVGALSAQLTEYARGASSTAVVVFGVTYLLRAIGDVQESFLTWLSPVGWAQATRAFVDERWWPLLLSAGVSVVVITAALVLLNRRDVAAGVFPQKPGPANASPIISNPLGFAYRQQRGGIIGWAIGLAVVGFAFGSLIGDVETFIDDNPQLEEFLAATNGSLVDAFLGLLIMVMSFLVTGFAIGSAMRPRAEESEGRAEPLLSTALSRWSWLGSYLLVAMLGSAGILLIGAGAVGITAALDQDDMGLLTGSLGAGLAYIPAVWLVIGLTSALYGSLPRLLVLPWLILIFVTFIGLFGDMLEVRGWIAALSPFEHVPELPGGSVEPWSIGILAAIAMLLIAIGQYTFRNRDLEMS